MTKADRVLQERNNFTKANYQELYFYLHWTQFFLSFQYENGKNSVKRLSETSKFRELSLQLYINHIYSLLVGNWSSNSQTTANQQPNNSQTTAKQQPKNSQKCAISANKKRFKMQFPETFILDVTWQQWWFVGRCNQN